MTHFDKPKCLSDLHTQHQQITHLHSIIQQQNEVLAQSKLLIDTLMKLQMDYKDKNKNQI
jgi:hypothetical protein